MVDVYVGVGSNIEPQRNIRRACALLSERFGALRLSSVFRSAPVGFSGSDFLNLVIGFSSDAGADVVETVLSHIESASGRSRDGHGLGHGDGGRSRSRTLDLDLLLYGRRVDAPRRLPRTDVLCYGFVLAPLARLAPGLTHPLTGQRIADVWRQCEATLPPLNEIGSVGDFDLGD